MLGKGGSAMSEVWNKEENRRVNLIVLLTLLSYLIGSILASFTKVTAIQLVVIQVFCVAPGLIALRMMRDGRSYGRAFTETYRVHKLRFSVILLAALMMLFLMPLLTLVNLVSQQFTSYVAGEDIMGRIQNYPFAVSLLCVGILPAIGEELVYRGLMYGHYRKRSILMGALLTGLIFGLMHGNLNQMAYAWLMGFVFAMVDEATGSTVSSMVMHALVNCGSVIIIYIVKWYPGTIADDATETVTLSPKMAAGYLVAATVGAYFAYRIYHEIAYRCCTEVQIQEDMKKPGRMKALRDMFTAPLVVTIVILTALVIATEIKLS